MLLWFKELVTGFFIGIANIIPGVSGGTFLLIFGIYERTIGVLNNLKPQNLKRGLTLVKNVVSGKDKGAAKKDLGEFVKELDLLFLIRICIGAFIAIMALSSLMKYLLLNHFSNTYAFFFGLILVSIIIPIKLLKTRKIWYVVFFLIGTALTIYVSASVNPYDKAKAKSELYQVRYEKQQAVGEHGTEETEKKLRLSGSYTPAEYLSIFIAGAIAISAMVLPGISGSLVLILLGQYFAVVSAISALKTLEIDSVIFLSVLALGMLIGILLFAKLVNFVFDKFHDQTMSFLIGLMAGSLYALWPFKAFVKMDMYVKENGGIELLKDNIVYTNQNISPENGAAIGFALLFCVVGMGIMGWFVGKEK